MEPAPFVAVGRVKDAHGLKGEIFILIFSGDSSWLPQLKLLRLRPPNGPPGPSSLFEARVTSSRRHKNGILVVSADIRDRTQAEGLRGYELEVPESFFVSKRGESIYLREIQGFVVTLQGGSDLGPIVAFSSNGAQDLLVIRTARGDFQIPFVTPFVVHIDYEGKRIEMALPPGLLGDDE